MAVHMNDVMLQATQDFDDLLITDQNNNPQGKLAFKTVLFFEGGGTAEGQLKAVEVLHDLSRDVADHISHMQTADPNSALTTFDADQFLTQSQAAITAGHADGKPFDLNVGLFGTPFDTQNGGVSAFGGSAVGAAPFLEGMAELSYLEFSTSLMWDAPNDFERQISRTLAAAAKLKPRHGLAGFGVQFDRIYESSSSHALSFPVIKRFPGIHCSMDSSFVVESTLRRDTSDRFFTTNWLTLLADDIVEGLGGAPALTEAVTDNCPTYAYDGGLILQAGPYPQPGDNNRGITMRNYQRVAEATKAARFADYEVGLFAVEPPLDSLEETKSWVARFDLPTEN